MSDRHKDGPGERTPRSSTWRIAFAVLAGLVTLSLILGTIFMLTAEDSDEGFAIGAAQFGMGLAVSTSVLADRFTTSSRRLLHYATAATGLFILTGVLSYVGPLEEWNPRGLVVATMITAAAATALASAALARWRDDPPPT